MCVYCEELKSLYYSKDYCKHSLKEIYIEPDKTLAITFWSGENEDSINLTIEFCPKCGRKLKEEKDE